MQLTTYSAAADFLTCARAWLEQHEAANNLMLGLVQRLQQFPERITVAPYYATVADEQGLAVAAVMTPPQRLIVCGDRADATDALALVLQNLAANGWSVPGILGPKDLAREAAERWTKQSGRSHHIHTRERIYELRRVNPLPPVPGRFRLATQDDVDVVAAWSVAFHREVDQWVDESGARENAAQRIADRAIYLWEDGTAVSMCVATRPTGHGISVGLVYTPPALRRRGYARAVVAAASQAMLAAGRQFCTLFTDLANPTSNHIYQEIGYAPVCDYDEYDFDP